MPSRQNTAVVPKHQSIRAKNARGCGTSDPKAVLMLGRGPMCGKIDKVGADSSLDREGRVQMP
jgi:hypothetical protein